MGATKTDLGHDAWTISDDVIRLREWGSDRSYLLPTGAATVATIGSSEACTLPLIDPSQRLSRQHVRLVRDGTRWIAHDLDSKNGMRLDGVRRSQGQLEPGCELGLGGITLIAESTRLIALRGFLARILGWTSDRSELVDLALRSVRLAATRRAALTLCGDGDLVPIARGLHRHALGGDRPFVRCDPRHTDEPGGMTILRAAAGGSICVEARRLPRDFAVLTTALRDPGTRVQLIVCGRRPSERADVVSAPIEIPPLSRRGPELDHIIDEYAGDAVAQLRCTARFSPVDRAWVRAHSAASLPEIEKGTLRLLALRETGSVARAAALLGMAHTSLGEWLGRRRIPAGFVGVTSAAARRV